MRTAGMIMGIIGGAIALLFAILIIFGGLTFMNLGIWDGSYNYNYDYDFDFNSDFDSDLNFGSFNNLDDLNFDNYDFDDELDNDFYESAENMGRAVAGTVFLVFGILTAIAGVLGLVGGLIVKKKNVAAGVLMIIAAVLSLFNIISMALFILGAVFSLMRDRSKQDYVPPYPMPPSYPYAPQAYPQPPQQSIPPQNPPENPQP